MPDKTLHIKVYGIVQGVGFRPFIVRLANKYNIRGSVCNRGSYVDIYGEAKEADLNSFLKDIEEKAPISSNIVKIETEEIESLDLNKNDTGFHIIESEKEEGIVFVSPDLSICGDCERELYIRSNRRYLHPFINCTNCGPRLTILDSMPYDRKSTSMGEFPMCPKCLNEYKNERDRRYHAQPVCCNEDGPRLYFINDGADSPDTSIEKKISDRNVIIKARKMITEGKILAIKGIGGFHLCCDASNEEAVTRLRRLKNRPVKPFAVMMRDIDIVRRECYINRDMEEVLKGREKPIMLLEKRADEQAILSKSIAPDNPNVGVMLPYAPLQMLLFRYPEDDITLDKDIPDCLVMTSGNPSGSPICMNDEEALEYLTPISDAILSNDRDIRIRTDDSVMAYYDGKPYMIRRSRGYAPIPIVFPIKSKETVLAYGGELKNTFCLAKGDMYYPSSYIGNIGDLRSINVLKSAILRMETLLEIRPKYISCDKHPGYNTSNLARSVAPKYKELTEVQHHHAHIVSCMAENSYMEDVIGVAFDGTGYGEDNTVWGGEFLIASLKDFKRIGSIDTFEQVGGDIASVEGWRIAAAILSDEEVAATRLCSERELKTIRAMSKNRINVVNSTSAGRIFDAASAILGICNKSTFEGEASMKLEFAATRAMKEGKLINNAETLGADFKDDFFTLRTNKLLIDITEMRIDGYDPEALALYFHKEIARMILEGCQIAKEMTGIRTVALSGGVFQNLLLLKLTDELLIDKGYRVLRHSMIPTNDGGISLGQAVVCMTRMNEEFN